MRWLLLRVTNVSASAFVRDSDAGPARLPPFRGRLQARTGGRLRRFWRRRRPGRFSKGSVRRRGRRRRRRRRRRGLTTVVVVVRPSARAIGARPFPILGRPSVSAGL